ncbi:MAG: HAD family hydrolase [Thermoplasmata archaeon]|nr:HAD family hydrolase [Thermoplasmata archaeon]MCI4358838.1 HAD family hydrolase [Thermoplasmata archaeon]
MPRARSRTDSSTSSRAVPLDGPIRALFFDFDDTLFDHTRSLVGGLRALRATDRRLSSVPFPRIVREYERLLDLIQPVGEGGPRTHPEARIARFRRLDAWLGGTGDFDTGERWSATYRAAYQSARRPVRGALPLLRSLHGAVTVGVVTNNHTTEQQEKIAALGLGRWIDFMVTSEEEGCLKPDPAIFRAALHRAGVAASESTMVGDSWRSDVLGAVSAGLGAVWLRRRGRRPAGFPTVRVIRSFTPVPTARRLLLERPRSRRPGGSSPTGASLT